MPDFILELIASNHQMAAVFAVMGLLRIINKPLFTIIRAIVEMTPDKKDDELLDEFEGSNTYKAFLYALDWFGSVKLKG
jgi:hypothetical protein